MRALQLSEDGSTVVNVILIGPDADPAEFDAVAAPSDDVGIGWTLSCGDWVAPPHVPTSAEVKALLSSTVSAHVQAVARARGYDSAEACASYATSTNATWRAEAAVFIAWRDVVWTVCHSEIAIVEAGEEAAKTPEVLVAGLPVIEWPEAAA